MSQLRRSRRLAGLPPATLEEEHTTHREPKVHTRGNVPLSVRACSLALGFTGSLLATFTLARVVTAVTVCPQVNGFCLL